MTQRGFVLLLAVGLLAACSDGKENVFFITSTQVDIGYDASIGNLNIGYDRNELMIGPAYVETGGLPPVAAALTSNLSIIEPKVSQVYATGNAAIIATSETDHTEAQIDASCGTRTAGTPAAGAGSAGNDTEVVPPDTVVDWVGCSNRLTGPRRVAVFGTSSNLGLKVGYDATGATSVSVGYKRREMSAIPLMPEQGRRSDTSDRYASVLGSIEIDTTIANPQGTKAELGQFFATGRAAEQLATRPNVRSAFSTYAEQAANKNFLKGVEIHGDADAQAQSVMDCVQRGGQTLTEASRARLAALADAARLPAEADQAVRQATSRSDLRRVLMVRYGNARAPLAEAVSGQTVQCDA